MIRDGKRYNLDFDPNGNPLLIDPATGEVTQGFYYPIFDGDQVITQAQQKARREYVESLKRAAGRRTAAKELGPHFFILGNQRFDDLRPQTAARLVYLETYGAYSDDSGNRLKLSSKTNMKRDDLKKVLRLGRDAVNDFWNEVNPRYLIEDENGLILNSEFFIKGQLPSGRSETYYRAYIRGVRKLYEGTPKSRHKHLGYFFELLPYINVEFNTLCFNPLEADADKIEHMTVDEFCEMIGYNANRRDRLLGIYKELKFEVTVNGEPRMERFVSITGDGLTKGDSKIYINPHVLYSGSDYKQVAILGSFHKDKA